MSAVAKKHSKRNGRTHVDVYFRVPVDLHARIVELAEREHRTMSGTFILAAEQMLERQPRRKTASA